MEQSEDGDCVDGPSEIVHEASLQVSCIWCGRLHQVERPLEFHPVCPACTGRFPMGSLEMNGSYPLNDEMIDAMVSRTSPGNYALGYMDGTTFMVFYVGRSDSDVKQRLHDWVDAPSRSRKYAPSAKAAYGYRHRGPLPLGVPALDRVGLGVDSSYTRCAYSYRHRGPLPLGVAALDRVGIGVDSSYTRFAFSYARSAEAAFEKECRNYHDFGGSDGLDNEGHPVSTPGSSAVRSARGTSYSFLPSGV